MGITDTTLILPAAEHCNLPWNSNKLTFRHYGIRWSLVRFQAFTDVSSVQPDVFHPGNSVREAMISTQRGFIYAGSFLGKPRSCSLLSSQCRDLRACAILSCWNSTFTAEKSMFGPMVVVNRWTFQTPSINKHTGGKDESRGFYLIEVL